MIIDKKFKGLLSSFLLFIFIISVPNQIKASENISDPLYPNNQQVVLTINYRDEANVTLAESTVVSAVYKKPIVITPIVIAGYKPLQSEVTLVPEEDTEYTFYYREDDQNLDPSINNKGTVTIIYKTDKGVTLDKSVYSNLGLNKEYKYIAKDFTGYQRTGAYTQWVTLTEFNPTATIEFLYRELEKTEKEKDKEESKEKDKKSENKTGSNYVDVNKLEIDLKKSNKANNSDGYIEELNQKVLRPSSKDFVALKEGDVYSLSSEVKVIKTPRVESTYVPIDKISHLKAVGLKPRFYRWNKEMSVWVAIPTKVVGSYVTTYSTVSGEIALFAVANETFIDEYKENWYTPNLEHVISLNIINTDQNNNLKFEGNRHLTRAEFYVMVAKIFGTVGYEEKAPYEILPSLDNLGTAGRWYEPYYKALLREGIVPIQDSKTLNSPITRLEAVNVLSQLMIRTNKYLPFKNLTESYIDMKLIPAVSVDFVSGYSDGKFYPNKALSRAEGVVFVSRALQVLGL